MCDYCLQIKLVKCIDTPSTYENIIIYVKDLIEKHGFLLIDGNCELGKHKDKNGCWIDDIIFHTIRCPKCGQIFNISVNTYRGGGSFRKGR